MRVFLFVIVLCVVAACNPAGKLLRQADEYAQQNDYDQAATYYYNVLLTHPNNERAQKGLQLHGQKVLTQKFASFSKLVIENKIEEAIKQHDYANQYYMNAKSVGVNLDWPSEYEEVYADIRSEYAGSLFDEAITLMNQRKYDQAEKKFVQIASMDTTYSGISVLRINTVLEALYKNASALMSKGKYKEAFAAWNKILNIDDNYRDSKAQADVAKSKSTLRLGVFPIHSNWLTIDDSYLIAIDNQLMKSSLAYVQLIGSKSLKTSLESRGWQSLTDLERAKEAAQTLGLNYFMYVQLVDYVDSFYQIKSEPTDAYEAFTANILNPYTGTYSYITKFKKVTFFDSYQKQLLRYKFRVMLVNNNTNSIMYNDLIHINKDDEAHEFSFKGDPNNLYRELPNGAYVPQQDAEWREQFIKAKRALVPKSILLSEAQRDIAMRLVYILNKNLK